VKLTTELPAATVRADLHRVLLHLSTAAVVVRVLCPVFLVLNLGVTKVLPLNVMMAVMIPLCLLAAYLERDADLSVVKLFNRNRTIPILIVLSVACEIVSTVFGSEAASWAGFVRMLLNVKMLFVVGLILGATRTRFEDTFDLFCALLFFTFLLAIYELVMQDLILGYIQKIFAPDDFYAQAVTADKLRDGIFRCNSLYEHPIILGIVSGTSIPLFLARLSAAATSGKKLYYAAAVIAAAIAAYASYSRSALVTMVAAVVFYFVYVSYWNYVRRNDKRFFLLLGGLAAAAVVGVPMLLSVIAGNSINEAVSTQGRALMWLNGLPYIIRSPLFGWGYGSDVAFVGIPIFGASGGNVGTVDDTYLSMMLNVGLAGIGLLLAILVIVFVRSRRVILGSDSADINRMRIALLAMIVGIIIGQKGNSIYFCVSLIYFFIGLLTSSSLYSINRSSRVKA
jgi:O-antigen ligase